LFKVWDEPPELILLLKGGEVENDVFMTYVNLRVLELLHHFPVVTLWEEHFDTPSLLVSVPNMSIRLVLEGVQLSTSNEQKNYNTHMKSKNLFIDR